MIGVDQVGRPVAVEVGPADRGVEADSCRQAGDHLAGAEPVIAQVQPIPAFAGRGAFQDQVGQPVAVQVGEFGVCDLDIIEREVGQRHRHGIGETSVAQARGHDHAFGAHTRYVRHAVAVAIRNLHRRVRKQETALLIDGDGRGVSLIAQIEPNSISHAAARRDALHDVHAFVEIQIGNPHVRFAERRGRRSILHGHILAQTPGGATAV